MCPSESPTPIDASTQLAVFPTLDPPGDTPKVMYRLCGDNIGKSVWQHHNMRSDLPKPESIHYFHCYAVANRINFSHLSEITPPLPNVKLRQIATSLLPTPDDNNGPATQSCRTFVPHSLPEFAIFETSI